MYRKLVFALTLCLLLLAFGLSAAGVEEESAGLASAEYEKWADTELDSLDDLSIEALRARNYGSEITLVEWLGAAGGDNEYQAWYAADGTPSYNTYMAAYRSDGLRVYTRVDVPSAEMPEDGYPVVIFAHGWVGEDGAPGYTLNYYENAYYGDIIDTYVDAGYIVLMPGFRGHATVDGIPAEGIEFLSKFDNGSYISPLFYAIDVLNLLDGVQTLENTAWSVWGYDSDDAVKINLDSIHISGHSQGGDAVLTALAVSGEGSSVRNPLSTGSIWSGCFPNRITQVETYGPMGESLEAFKAGTQEEFEWNGTAIGSDGSVNPDFIFPWAPDWIGTMDPSEWGWQADYFGKSVAFMLDKKYGQMYDTINSQAADIDDAQFSLSRDASGKAVVTNDPRIEAYSRNASAVNFPQYLVDERIVLHHSDRDYYAMPAWNADLAAAVKAAGGWAADFNYPANSHSLTKSGYGWYNTGVEVVPGRVYALQRDLSLFSSNDPLGITYP